MSIIARALCCLLILEVIVVHPICAEVDGDGNAVIPIGASRLLRIVDESLAQDYMVVEQATGALGIGDASPDGLLDVTATALNNRTAVVIDQNDTDQTALDINAANTTTDILDINGSALTTGHLIQGTVADALNTDTALVSVTGTALNTATLVKINELSTTPANDVDVTAVHVERGTDDARITFDEGVDRWQADNGEGAGLLDMPLVLNRAATLNDVVSTNAATTLYTFSVPANVMGINRALRLRIIGDYLNNTGVTQTLTLAIAFGGTTIYSDPTVANASSAARRPFHLDIMIANQNSSSVQFSSGLFLLGTNGGATTGIGNLATDEIQATTPFASNGTSAVNTASAQNLTVTVTHSASSANLSIRRQYAILELL